MRSACAVLQSICFRLQTKGGCRCPPARGNGAFLQARTFKEPGDLKVCPAVPFPSLSVSHLPCRNLGFHRREAGHASLSEVLQALHSDLELHLKPGPPAGYCTGAPDIHTMLHMGNQLVIFSLQCINTTQQQPNKSPSPYNHCFFHFSQMPTISQRPLHPFST